VNSPFDPTPVQRIFGDHFSAEERAWLAETCQRHGITSDHPVLLVMAETLLYRQRLQNEFARIDSRGNAFVETADRIEALVAQLETMNKSALAADIAVTAHLKTEPGPPKTTEQKKTDRKTSTHFVFRPAQVASVLALTGMVGIVAWFGGATDATARTRFASDRVATMLTTPAGQAAMHVLEANGADLPGNLARCRRFAVDGRRAIDCVLWDGPPLAAGRSSPLWAVTLAARQAPAWPFFTIALIALAGLATRMTRPLKVRVR